jgi:hypothetical protein
LYLESALLDRQGRTDGSCAGVAYWGYRAFSGDCCTTNEAMGATEV